MNAKKTQYGYVERPSIYTTQPVSANNKTQSGIGVGTGEATKKKCGIVRINTANRDGNESPVNKK